MAGAPAARKPTRDVPEAEAPGPEREHCGLRARAWRLGTLAVALGVGPGAAAPGVPGASGPPAVEGATVAAASRGMATGTRGGPYPPVASGADHVAPSSPRSARPRVHTEASCPQGGCRPAPCGGPALPCAGAAGRRAPGQRARARVRCPRPGPHRSRRAGGRPPARACWCGRAASRSRRERRPRRWGYSRRSPRRAPPPWSASPRCAP